MAIVSLGILQIGEISPWTSVGLASVCACFYFSASILRSRHSAERATLTAERDRLRAELQASQDRESDLQLENAVLRGFLTERDPKNAIAQFLKRASTKSQSGIAAFLCYDRETEQWQLQHSRGMGRESRRTFTVDNHLCEQALVDRHVRLDTQSLSSSQLFHSLSRRDRRQIVEAHLVSCGAAGDDWVFFTTQLFPGVNGKPSSIPFLTRILRFTVPILEVVRKNLLNEDRVNLSQDQLYLRSITDESSEAAEDLVTHYLNALLRKVDAKQATLFADGGDGSFKSIVRCGVQLPAGTRRTWHQHELTLARISQDFDSSMTLDQQRLADEGITTLVGSAAIVSVTLPGNRRGVVCVTRTSMDSFSPHASRLLAWTGEHLTQAIARAFNLDEARREALRDGLTRLHNRRSFDQHLEIVVQQALKNRHNTSLLLLDLDHFKSINDRFGHQTGDDVLRMTADLLRSQLRRLRAGERPFAARYGGEELAVLLSGTGEAGAKRVAESIRSAIAQQAIPCDTGTLSITASVGLACLPANGRTPAELVAAADAALYQAKEGGRNRVVMATAPRPLTTHTP